MKTLINLQDVETVQLGTYGYTDKLTIGYKGGIRRSWSVYHYEESYRQRERCKQLNDAYKSIKGAIESGMARIEIHIDD